MTNRSSLSLRAMNWVIAFDNCEDIAVNAARVLSRWDSVVDPPAQEKDSKLRAIVGQARGKWAWQANRTTPPRYWHKLPPKTPMHVLCEVQDVMIDWYLEFYRDHLCLHGAAAKIGRGLVCFPARGLAGKSTLIAHLLYLGQKVFCDDVLAIEPRTLHGKSLGLPPRLRVPLPRRITHEVREYLRDHTLVADKEWMYVDPGRSGLADLNETAPFTALVFLERKRTGTAHFEAVGASEMLKELILQNIARKIRPAVIFDTLHSLVVRAPRYRLVYSDPLEAARLIVSKFGGRRR
jgi:hypothetical protein